MNAYISTRMLLTGLILITLFFLCTFLFLRYIPAHYYLSLGLDKGTAPLIAQPQNPLFLELPKEVSFAGETAPLYDPEVRERLDKELHINVFWRSQMTLIIKRANRFFPTIEKILREEGVPEDFKYVAAIESTFENLTSSAGAKGYWQFMPATGKEHNLEISDQIEERYHLEKSTRAACVYFKKAFEKFNNWTLVAASYNRGMTGIQRQLERQEAQSYYDLALNQETARYVYRILAFKEIMENPSKYGFDMPKSHLYPLEKMRLVKVDTTVENLATLAQQLGVSYKTLKYYNPWLLGASLEVKTDKSYYIELPYNPPRPHSEVLREAEKKASK
ncbi:MAG: lytic transglycosylase domain-containing protein [Bernardetiaceae bacterium]|nr:lytic transglycosylase domain-containing protein [Bernardetiaceae bacterium]